MLRDRRWVWLFIAVQIAVPAVLLGVRVAEQGWWPTEAQRFGWQMFSLTDAERLCELRDRC